MKSKDGLLEHQHLKKLTSNQSKSAQHCAAEVLKSHLCTGACIFGTLSNGHEPGVF